MAPIGSPVGSPAFQFSNMAGPARAASIVSGLTRLLSYVFASSDQSTCAIDNAGQPAFADTGLGEQSLEARRREPAHQHERDLAIDHTRRRNIDEAGLCALDCQQAGKKDLETAEDLRNSDALRQAGRVGAHLHRYGCPTDGKLAPENGQPRLLVAVEVEPFMNEAMSVEFQRWSMVEHAPRREEGDGHRSERGVRSVAFNGRGSAAPRVRVRKFHPGKRRRCCTRSGNRGSAQPRDERTDHGDCIRPPAPARPSRARAMRARTSSRGCVAPCSSRLMGRVELVIHVFSTFHPSIRTDRPELLQSRRSRRPPSGEGQSCRARIGMSA